MLHNTTTIPPLSLPLPPLQQSDVLTTGRQDGGGDGAGDDRSPAGAADTEDSRRQILLTELENLSFEMKKQNESEQVSQPSLQSRATHCAIP